jgi:hypothetical protein
MLSTPPGDGKIDLTRDDAAGGRADRIRAAGAEPVDRRARHADRQPASKAAMRATLRLSSPAWFAHPK